MREGALPAWAETPFCGSVRLRIASGTALFARRHACIGSAQDTEYIRLLRRQEFGVERTDNDNCTRPVWDDDQSDPDEQVWRYMSVDRLTWLLTQRRLYFAAATQFADNFEGATAVQEYKPPEDPRFPDVDPTERAFRELRRLTKINCWHRADYESDAMWKLYAAQGKGMAICSSRRRLQDALRPFRLQPSYGAEWIWFGPVRYVDLTKVRLRTSMERRFFFKHQAFAWEREYRLAVSMRSAEFFAVEFPELGVEVSVDLNTLISRIVLGPDLAKQDRGAAEDMVKRAGFGDRLEISSLLWHPRHI